LAASFAPAVEELDALLSSPGMEFTSQLQRIQRQQQQQQRRHNCPMESSSRTQQQQQSTTNDCYANDSDNESIDDELQHLEASELLLRQELEFAHDFGNLMNSPYYKNTLKPEQRRLSFTQQNESPPHPSVESFDTVPAFNHLPLQIKIPRRDPLHQRLLRHHQDVDYHFELLPYGSVLIHWSELSWMLLFKS
jgi:hypothetical protein